MIPVFSAPNGDEYGVELLMAKHQIWDIWNYYKHNDPREVENVRQMIAKQLAENIAKQIIDMSPINFETWCKNTSKETIIAKAYVLVKI